MLWVGKIQFCPGLCQSTVLVGLFVDTTRAAVLHRLTLQFTQFLQMHMGGDTFAKHVRGIYV